MLSAWLRSLLPLEAATTPVRAFFCRVQAPRRNRLVQRIARHLDFATHLRHALALVQQRLRPLLHFRRQHAGRTPPPRPEEPGAPVFAMHLHVPLHRRQRHAKRLHDISLPHRPIGDQLTGEHPEALHLSVVVLKHRKQPMEIHHLPALPLEGQVLIDRSQTLRKDRQLKLGHGPVSLVGPARASARSEPVLGRVIFPPPPKSRGDFRSSESRLCRLGSLRHFGPDGSVLEW